MPEIVELHVALRSEDNVICQEGIAHLVFFGNHDDESGLTTMDLRIKKKTPTNPNAPSDLSEQPLLFFEEDSYVRVQVEIVSEHDGKQKYVFEDMPVGLESFNQQKIGGIMEQLREHEEMAVARAKAVKLNFDKEETEKPFFCNSGGEFKQSIRAFFEAFRRCNSGRPRAEKHFGNEGILPVSSTMDSTIVTRESLNI
jgi:hypothetical protein